MKSPFTPEILASLAQKAGKPHYVILVPMKDGGPRLYPLAMVNGDIIDPAHLDLSDPSTWRVVAALDNKATAYMEANACAAIIASPGQKTDPLICWPEHYLTNSRGRIINRPVREKSRRDSGTMIYA